MLNSYKNVLILFVIFMLQACGGGGKTIYFVNFNATVSGLAAGETLTVVTALSGTNQSATATVSSNGAWSATINLPDGVSVGNGPTITVTQQPVGKICSVTYTGIDGGNLNSTIKCSPASAAGLYFGKFGSTTGRAELLILNDGSYWMFTGTETANVTSYTGLVQSSFGSSTATTYTSNTGVDIFSSPQITNTGVSGTYVAGSSFNGTFSQGSSQYALTLTRPVAGSYQFGEVPTLSKIAGTYAGTQSTFTISSAGTMTGQTSTGCQFNGTATPKTTGENAYGVAITFGAAPCTAAFQATPFAGVVIIETTTLGIQLLGAVVNSSKTAGLMLIQNKN